MTDIKIIEETIYPDGSGSCGLYEVYGMRFSGISNHNREVTITPLVTGSGRRTHKERGMRRTATKAVARHIEQIEQPAWEG